MPCYSIHELVCSREREALVATPSSKFFTQSPWTDHGSKENFCWQTMTKTLWSRNNTTLFTRPYLCLSHYFVFPSSKFTESNIQVVIYSLISGTLINMLTEEISSFWSTNSALLLFHKTDEQHIIQHSRNVIQHFSAPQQWTYQWKLKTI